MLQKLFRTRKLKAILFFFVDLFFIKDKNKILFVVKNRTYFSGNLKVVCYKYIEERNNKIFIYKDGKCKKEIKEELRKQGVTVLDGFTLKSIYHIATSGVVILSHNPRDAHITKIFNSRKIINLWHGVAIKKIEQLMEQISKTKTYQLKNNAKLYNLVIASSKTDKDTNIKAFGVSSNIVKVTGLPRYELLKNKYDSYTLIKKEIESIKRIKGDKKLILYAPTFRENIKSSILQIEDSEWLKLNNYIEKNNYIFGIRPHPYDIQYLPSKIQKFKNIVLFSSADFIETNLLLRETDILIVDYSSIWVDYLLLDRPIFGYAKDFEHYLNEERGFIYNFNDIFPAPFVDNIDKLIENINNKAQFTCNTKRQNVTKILHQFSLDTNFDDLIYKAIEEIR